jgi:hypothetical protein
MKTMIMVMASVSLISGCAKTTTPSPADIQISPSSESVIVNHDITFSASGGTSPYSYNLQSGEGTVTTSGQYQAGTSPGESIVTVTDANGNAASATITVTN